MSCVTSQDYGATSTVGAVSLFTSISAPILRSVDPVKVARFLKECERYELEITAKQSELPTLKVLPYTASIDRSLIKNLFFMGKFDSIADGVTSASDLNDEHIKVYIDSLVSTIDESEMDPTIIEKAIEGLSMPNHIANADARVTHFCSDFLERLEGVGFCNFRIINPNISISLLMSRVSPPALKREMRKRINYDEDLERNLKNFIKILTR